jgi:protein tyrosine phosphatase (PTP) superfamily phosphohydrolase (DUF442 family)
MLEDIYNFLPFTETLLSSGMLTAGQMAEVSKSGVELVINLALPTSEKALPNEADLVSSLGMKYIGIPVKWEEPTRQNLEDFMTAMDANRENKILVHCQANYRATGFITLYRILRLGWAPAEAFKDLRRIWNLEDYPIWKKFIEENLIKNP